MWLRKMVNKAKKYPEWSKKTVFKVQTYNWSRNNWIEDSVLLKEIRDILATGGRHIAYYPDNFLLDKPMAKNIRREMSTCIYPFTQ